MSCVWLTRLPWLWSALTCPSMNLMLGCQFSRKPAAMFPFPKGLDLDIIGVHQTEGKYELLAARLHEATARTSTCQMWVDSCFGLPVHKPGLLPAVPVASGYTWGVTVLGDLDCWMMLVVSVRERRFCFRMFPCILVCLEFYEHSSTSTKHLVLARSLGLEIP